MVRISLVLEFAQVAKTYTQPVSYVLILHVFNANQAIIKLLMEVVSPAPSKDVKYAHPQACYV